MPALCLSSLLLLASCNAPDPFGIGNQGESSSSTDTSSPLPGYEPESPVTIEIPDLIGQRLSVAREQAESLGLSVRVRRKASSQDPGTVLRQTPPPGSQADADAPVRLVVAKKKPATQSSSPTCHPSYTGACLDPNASDYDCAGGSGNGPKYTGPVQVVGYDEYGLDTDDDGYGCE